MASCKLGHVYIVPTGLTKPPKDKFAICVCVDPDWFVWINTKAAPHGLDQLPIPSGCHRLITHDSHVDLSRIVVHQAWELDEAQEFPKLPEAIVNALIAMIDLELELMPSAHSVRVRAGLAAIYP